MSLLVGMSTFLTSCREDPLLTVDCTTINIPATGGNEKFTITANEEAGTWYISSDQSWVSLSQTLGANNQTITVSAKKNESVEQLSAILTIQSEADTKQITVTQDGGTSTLSVDISDISLDADGGSKSISINSNVSWTVTGNSGWLTVSPSSGSGNKAVVIQAEENNTTSTRSCDLVIKTDDGTLSNTVKVTQSAAIATLKVNGATETTLNFDADGNEVQQINITANSDWTISNIPDWLQVSPINGSGNSNIQIKTLSENFSDEERECVLYINGNNVTANLGINQAAKLAKNVRVSMSNLTTMCDGFACDLTFGSAAKGYREAFYVDNSSTASYTDRDFYNKLMGEVEYSGVMNWTYVPGWVDPGTTIIYCVAAYGNENNPDGTHKYGPMLIKRITTPQQTIYDDMYLSLSYTSTRWSVTTSRVGSYGQRCDEYYIWASVGESADTFYSYVNSITYAFMAHFYMEPMIKGDPNDGYKYGPQTINYTRENDTFFMACWGIDRDTKNFSSEMTTIYKNLEAEVAPKRIHSNPSTWNKKRHIVTKEEVEEMRKSVKVYCILK